MCKRKMGVSAQTSVRGFGKEIPVLIYGFDLWIYRKFLGIFCVRNIFLGKMYEYGGRRIMAEGMPLCRLWGWYIFNHIILEMRQEIKKTGQKARPAASDHFGDHS